MIPAPAGNSSQRRPLAFVIILYSSSAIPLNRAAYERFHGLSVSELRRCKRVLLLSVMIFLCSFAAGSVAAQNAEQPVPKSSVAVVPQAGDAQIATRLQRILESTEWFKAAARVGPRWHRNPRGKNRDNRAPAVGRRPGGEDRRRRCRHQSHRHRSRRWLYVRPGAGRVPSARLADRAVLACRGSCRCHSRNFGVVRKTRRAAFASVLCITHKIPAPLGGRGSRLIDPNLFFSGSTLSSRLRALRALHLRSSVERVWLASSSALHFATSPRIFWQASFSACAIHSRAVI